MGLETTLTPKPMLRQNQQTRVAAAARFGASREGKKNRVFEVAFMTKKWRCPLKGGGGVAFALTANWVVLGVNFTTKQSNSIGNMLQQQPDKLGGNGAGVGRRGNPLHRAANAEATLRRGGRGECRSFPLRRAANHSGATYSDHSLHGNHTPSTGESGVADGF
jgi:hypothetical protein